MKRSVLGWSYKNLWNNIFCTIYWRMFEEKSVCSSSFNDWLRFRIDFKWIFSIDIFRQCSFITIFFLVSFLNYEKWIIFLIGTWSTRFLRVWKCFPREYYQEAWIRLLMANHRGIFAEMKTAARLSRPSLKHSFFLVACASASFFPRKIPFLFRCIVTIP